MSPVVSETVSPVRIRRATAADAAALCEFGARTFAETFGPDNTSEDLRLHLASAWRPDLQSAEIANSGWDTLLACDENGALAGFAQVRERAPRGIVAVRPIELYRFYVDKPWQGRGVAQALMRAAEEAARSRRARELWLGVWERNPRAQAFYRKCGFRRVGEQVFIVGTDPQTDHVMLKELQGMRIEHVGIWVSDIERVAAFYAKYFGARVGAPYENPRKGFTSRFLEFDGGARLEIMHRVGIAGGATAEQLGLAHVAIAVGGAAEVDALAERFRADGITPDSGPRRTGDGYYECVVRDVEGNRVEITAG